MYSHKRSFTGQSSRSVAALFDVPFLISGLLIAAIFSVTHSAVTYFSLHENIRAWPAALEQLPLASLTQTLRDNTDALNWTLILATCTGLALPLVIFSIAIRWTLAPLRVTVQRTVTSCCLAAFYICSFMSTALSNPEWASGNTLVRLFSPLGGGVFQSLRAVLCLSVFIGCIYTLAKNATSRINRGLRIFAAALALIVFMTGDFIYSQQKRSVSPAYLKAPASVRFIFVVPGLKPADIQKALKSEPLTDVRNQLSSFQEVHPSTPSLLGQFVTTLLGIEPNTHGIRHDFIDPEILEPAWTTVHTKAFPKGHEVYAMAIGGPAPLSSLVGAQTAGSRCGHEPSQLARLGHFQTSVVPYALTPRFLEPYLNRDLICSNRFLTLHQHLIQAHEKMTDQLHESGLKTFVIWVSPSLRKTDADLTSKPKDYEQWEPSTKNIFQILKSHKQFLNNTKLTPFHQTFVVGLAEQQDATTAFVRFDGQIKAQLTDLTLDSPGQRSQLSLADLLRSQQNTDLKDSQFFYSEFTDSMTKDNVGRIAPDFMRPDLSKNIAGRFIVSADALRKNIVNSKRHVICQSVASPNGRRLLVKVSLNLRATDNRLPQLTYEDVEKENLPSPENQMDLEDCLKSAREILTESVFKDVSLRDSSAFQTLLTGLPVKSIKTNTATLDMGSETEDEAFGISTSTVPNSPVEEEDE